MSIDRRKFIKISGLTTIGVAAGCTSTPGTEGEDGLPDAFAPDAMGDATAADGEATPDATMDGGDVTATEMDATALDATADIGDATATDTASASDPDMAADEEGLNDAVIEDSATADADVTSPDDTGASGDVTTGSSPPENRVVRIHNDQAHDWDFNDAPGNRYYDHISQSAIDDMLDQGVLSLTGETDTTAAWRGIMRTNNPAGYVSGDRVAIKVNNNNRWADDQGQPNSDPEIIGAVVAGLKSIGVSESDIFVYDTSRRQIARVTDGVQAVYPGVTFVGLAETVRDEDAWVTFSSAADQRLPTVVSQSQHLINLHMMKGHKPGITGAMKNHFGTIETPSALHPDLELGPTLSELNNNPHIKDKTRLLLTEAIFCNPSSYSNPPVQLSYLDLFPEGTPNSLFLATKPVSLDSVLYDYIGAEQNNNGGWLGPDTWLHVAASDFDLGIHEHGTLSAGTYSTVDFTYSEIDYVNLSI